MFIRAEVIDDLGLTVFLDSESVMVDAERKYDLETGSDLFDEFFDR